MMLELVLMSMLLSSAKAEGIYPFLDDIRSDSHRNLRSCLWGFRGDCSRISRDDHSYFLADEPSDLCAAYDEFRIHVQGAQSF